MTDNTDEDNYYLENKYKSGYTEENIEWRRNKVMELLSHGYVNQSEISRIMQVPLSTINADVKYLRNRAKENVARFTDTFAFEFDKCLYEANMIQKSAWELANNSRYERNRILSLSLCREILQYKTDLISNADIVLRASNFIEIKKKKIETMLEQEGDDSMVEFASGPRRLLPAPTDDEPSGESSATDEQEEAVT